jgi:hypothetical protein
MFGIIKSWKYFDNELIGDEEVADAYVKTCTYNITKSPDIFTLQSTYITNKIKKEFFKPSYIPKKDGHNPILIRVVLSNLIG